MLVVLIVLMGIIKGERILGIVLVHPVQNYYNLLMIRPSSKGSDYSHFPMQIFSYLCC